MTRAGAGERRFVQFPTGHMDHLLGFVTEGGMKWTQCGRRCDESSGLMLHGVICPACLRAEKRREKADA